MNASISVGPCPSRAACIACRVTARQALRAAREGQGPTLIEAFTYRMGAHTTTDDPTRYRLLAELESWKLKDPIERVKQYLIRFERADMSFFDNIDAEADQIGTRIRKACLEMPSPRPLSIFDNVYAGPNALLQSEREQLAVYLDSFTGEEGPAGDQAPVDEQAFIGEEAAR